MGVPVNVARIVPDPVGVAVHVAFPPLTGTGGDVNPGPVNTTVPVACAGLMVAVRTVVRG